MGPSLEETIHVDFITSDPTTGAADDADTTPTVEVFEDATDTAILTPTATKRTGKTGNYRIPVACTAANGFEAGKSYNVVVSATCGGVAGKAVVFRFQLRAASLDTIPGDVWDVAPAATPLADIAAAVLEAFRETASAELSSLPAANAPILDKIDWLFALARNKTTVTGSAVNLRNDADSGNIATLSHSDDGTTYTRNEWS